MKGKQFGLVTIGFEYLSGSAKSWPSLWISAKCEQRSWSIRSHCIVEPKIKPIHEAMLYSLQHGCDCLILVGGRSLVSDCVALEALGQFIHRPRVLKTPVYDHLKDWFSDRTVERSSDFAEIDSRRIKQAQLPDSSEIMLHPACENPACAAWHDGNLLLSLPDDSEQVQRLFSESVIPWLVMQGLGPDRPPARDVETSFRDSTLLKSVLAVVNVHVPGIRSTIHQGLQRDPDMLTVRFEAMGATGADAHNMLDKASSILYRGSIGYRQNGFE